jgi:uncharacterized delta-60 repeat protein
MDFLLARYTLDGVLDASFGTAGKVVTNWASTDTITSLALQADGKIIVGGQFGSGGTANYALARYNANGTVDTSFGGTGALSFDWYGYGDTLTKVLVQPDGKILAIGTAAGPSDSKLALARFNANGTLDGTFGGGGGVVTDVLTNVDNAMDAVLQADGKIVVVGKSAALGGTAVFCVVRYNSNGTLDSTFSGDGKLTTAFAAGSASANRVGLQGTKIVVGGLANYNFAFARYNSDGTLDTSFGSAGTTVIAETNGYYNGIKYIGIIWATWLLS